jgi:predicted esterase YcpF (UPF0227 family)
MIIYLHGYGSSGNGPKTDLLVQRFGRENVAAPDLPVNPNQVVAIVNKIVHETKTFPLIFVGSSLGGFWANYFAQLWDAPCIIVNPAILPSEQLLRHGVSEKVADLYKPYEAKLYGDSLNNNLINLFAAKDDEIASYENTLKTFPNAKFTEITDTGGHRYLSNWNAVMDRIEELGQTT